MLSMIATVALLNAIQTKHLYIGDLTHETPMFDNAPDFSFNGSLRGENPIGQPKKHSRKSKQQNTKELVDVLQMMYPDAQITVYGDHIFVK
jgi:hypothetical protein